MHVLLRAKVVTTSLGPASRGALRLGRLHNLVLRALTGAGNAHVFVKAELQLYRGRTSSVTAKGWILLPRGKLLFPPFGTEQKLFN